MAEPKAYETSLRLATTRVTDVARQWGKVFIGRKDFVTSSTDVCNWG